MTRVSFVAAQNPDPTKSNICGPWPSNLFDFSSPPSSELRSSIHSSQHHRRSYSSFIHFSYRGEASVRLSYEDFLPAYTVYLRSLFGASLTAIQMESSKTTIGEATNIS